MMAQNKASTSTLQTRNVFEFEFEGMNDSAIQKINLNIYSYKLQNSYSYNCQLRSIKAQTQVIKFCKSFLHIIGLTKKPYQQKIMKALEIVKRS